MSLPRPSRVTVVLALAALLTLPAAGAAAQPAEEVGDYGGRADASVLELDVLETTPEFADGLTLLDASVAPTSAAADTAGGLSHDGEDGLTSFGTGTNAGLALAEELAAEDLLVEATQTAPPDNEEATSEQLLEVPVDPLLTSDVATAEALARDSAEVACPPDDQVSYGTSEVNQSSVLPEAVDGADLARLAGVVDTRSELVLTDVEGQDTEGVRSEATASVSSLDLFGGEDAGGLTVDILSEPRLTAVAGGTTGSASVDYDAPMVEINGEGFAADEEQRFTIPPDAAEGEEDLLLDIALGSNTSETSEDGTEASGEASVLEVTVLDAQGLTLAELAVAPMSVEATGPPGGVDCTAADDPDDGIDVDVDGPDEVDPGDEYDSTIEVTNARDCPITDLEVVGEVTGPDGTQITATDPEGTVDGLTATWDDLDDLSPDETVTLTATVSVPTDAEGGTSLRTDATADGECDGDEVGGEGSFDGPTVADDGDDPSDGDDPADGDDDSVLGGQDSADGGPSPAAPAADEASKGLPATGGGLALAGLAALGGAWALRRRG